MAIQTLTQSSLVTMAQQSDTGTTLTSAISNGAFDDGIASINSVRVLYPLGTIQHRNDGSCDDSYGIAVRIMSGATVLAAQSSGGNFHALSGQQSRANAATWTDVTGDLSPSYNEVFPYKNASATKAQWDAAVIEWEQGYSTNMGGDKGQFRINTTCYIEVDYATVGRSITGTTEALRLTANDATIEIAFAANLDFSAAVAGDVLIAIICLQDLWDTQTPDPVGWTKIANGYGGTNGYYANIEVWTKVATGSEGIVTWLPKTGEGDEIFGYAQIMDGSLYSSTLVATVHANDLIWNVGDTESWISTGVPQVPNSDGAVLFSVVSNREFNDDGPLANGFTADPNGATKIAEKGGTGIVSALFKKVIDYNIASTVWSAGVAIPHWLINVGYVGDNSSGLMFGGQDDITNDTSHEWNGTTWAADVSMLAQFGDHAYVGTQSAALASHSVLGGATTNEYNGTVWSSAGTPLIASTGARGCGTLTTALIVLFDSLNVQEFDGATWTTGTGHSASHNLGTANGTNTATLAIGRASTDITTGEEYNGTAWSNTGTLPAYNNRISYCASFGTLTDSIVTGGTGGVSSHLLHDFDYNGTAWSAGRAPSYTTAQAGAGGSSAGAQQVGGRAAFGASLTAQAQVLEAAPASGLGFGSQSTTYTTPASGSIDFNTASVVVNTLSEIIPAPDIINVVGERAKFKTKPYKSHTKAISPKWSRTYLVGYAPTIDTSQPAAGDRLITGVTEALHLTENAATVDKNVPRTIVGVTEALHLTENQATVTTDVPRNIICVTEALHLTENTAAVARDRNLTCTTEALRLTENQATVKRDRTVTGASEALLLTTNQALVAQDRLVACTTEQLTLGLNQAAIDLARSVSTVTEVLHLTTNLATVDRGTNDLDIIGTTEALSLTANAAAIQTDRDITAVTEALLLTENPASVDASRLVVGTSEALTLTTNQATVTILLKQVLSVVPASFPNGTTGVVINTQAIDTSTATVYIMGTLQTITGTTANSITITTVRDGQPVGLTTLTVVC